jgi:anhydro-N-acetylmuramic acid kinase
MRVIGVMSGTSADGIDVALCEINGAPPRLSARILDAMTIPYQGERQRILEACQPSTSDVESLCLLNADLGAWISDAISRLLQKTGGTADLIGSHGQTVWHAVQADGQVAATLQLGEASVIAEHTGITIISNFRSRDVAAGGQGAPLTGYVDWLLLRHETHWRAIQNIGGMGNVSFLPPLNVEAEPLVFDTGPGNALIDIAASRLTNGTMTYDRDGEIARYGEIDDEWLERLLEHPYFERMPPKTTGRELFGSAFAEKLYDEGLKQGLTGRDVVATLTALTAKSIANAYQRFAPAPIGEVILGGGGRHNPTLIGMMQHHLKDIPIHSHEDIGIDSDQKEALVFAVLAYETWHNRPGSLPVQTGARRPVVLGQITPGDNYADLIRKTWCAV